MVLPILFLSSCQDSDDNDTKESPTTTVTSIVNNSTISAIVGEEIVANNLANHNDGKVDNGEINEFIFLGLNNYYLFRQEQSAFTNISFSTAKGFEEYAASGGTPEAFFEKLTVAQDRFSWIVDDYEELEAQFAGESKQTGLSFIALLVAEGSEDVVLISTRVSRGSPAARAGVERGDFFNRINGQKLTRNNFSDIFDKDSYTLGRANSINGTIVDASGEVFLTKEVIRDGTVPVEKVIEQDGLKIGYVFYSQFVRGSQEELNQVFRRLKSQNIDELVLDLRYNGGGSIATAVALSSMITGQFNGQVLVKQQWNPLVQAAIEADADADLTTDFVSNITIEKEGEEDKTESINSLNLSRVYVLMTKRQTASASELVINGLEPYIDVVTIGDGSVGKSEGSITLYDSPAQFNKEKINEDHTYAMQPLVLRSINKNNTIVPTSGLTPDISFTEDLTNLGELGELSDPFLKLAIDRITGNNSVAAKSLGGTKNKFGEVIGSNQNPNDPLYQKMYQ